MRFQGRKAGFAIALSIVTAILIAGCGGGSESGGTSSGASGKSEIPPTLKVVVGAEFGSLDPNIAFGEVEAMVSGLVAGTLTKYQVENPGEPELAEKLTHNQNYTEWVATLKPGLNFSNGEPVTAADVKATFDRILKSEEGPFAFVANLTSVTVKNPRTVRFEFSKPDVGFASIASLDVFGIWPAAGLKEGDSFWKHPISAGPYEIESYDSSRVKLTLNSSYSGPKEERPKQVEFNVVEDPGTRLAQVKTGQANWAFDLPANLIPQMTGSVEKQIAPVPSVYQLLMNNSVKPFDDVRVRRAVSFALDREAISQTAFGGEAKPTSRYWPEIFAERAEAEEKLQETGPNIAAAKRELKGTECENGCTVSLLGKTTTPWNQPAMLLIQQQLEAIGMKVNLQSRDYATASEEEAGGEYEMALEFFVSPAPAEEALALVNFGPGPPLYTAWTKFESKKVGGLIEKLAATPLAERHQVGLELGEVFAEEMPWAALANVVFVNASNLPESVVHQELFALKVK